MKYKQGDILEDEDGGKRKVLGVCGEVYLMSINGKFLLNCSGYTQHELDEHGYNLVTTPKQETIY